MFKSHCLLTLLMMFSSLSHANPLRSTYFACTIGQSYIVRHLPEQKVLELWEHGGAVASPLTEDQVLMAKIEGPMIKLQLKTLGTLEVSLENPWQFGFGLWKHQGRIDRWLLDAPEDRGTAELVECTDER